MMRRLKARDVVDWIGLAKSAVGLVAIVNPPIAVPIFVSLTEGQSSRDRRRTARLTGLSVLIILMVSAWIGGPLLGALGIRFSSFRVGGGILLLLMAIAMLHARQTGSRRRAEELEEAETKEQVAVVPLALPILAGPGAISLVILDFQRGDDLMTRAGICLNIALVALLVWVMLRSAERVAAVLGKTGINIVSRIMGLLLAALAVELIASGLLELFPGLGG